ncbi:hypothetical protein [Bordetella bronchiseptica]|uniref:hypothetical protein n=1 Tax=Bordetella bronchiseptica TaxID=518 RepID=UPI000461B624|nr:hypothetical protein [Bordetella bronchiseptica]KDC15280.1 hypothetical protein L542_2110 [Bordetella bronchiseptica F-1]KDC29305.1 hypothetical protein L504_2136 [Bordetella bronchiseptica F2]
MIRRLLASLDRDHAVAALAIVCVVLAYGHVQQADEAAALTTHAASAPRAAN